ncbi:MAG: family 10 glycosylhydrolase [Clostridia bacterium]|nr:family 10 glycosylhydrolase [Clostridia bacterium]
MIRIFSFFLCLFIVLGLYFFALSAGFLDEGNTNTPSDEEKPASELYEARNYDKPKAIWLSQFDMKEIYTNAGGQRDIAEYTALLERVISNVASMGINTVFIQLRPNGDSIYPSELFPASIYVTGAYGEEHEYDPFQIFLDLAHKEDLSVHAWINPLRCMSVDKIDLISQKYEIKQWYLRGKDSPLREVSGYLYLDPAYEEARQLVCAGALEIIKKYNVDGIHIDDYFYPTTDESFDADSYAAMNADSLSLADFRRAQIDLLVSSIHDTVKEQNPTLLFGVSPSGNNDRNFNELYADVSTWCREGYIDYLAPQIYFGFEHTTRPFDEVLREFSELAQAGDVPLVVGITLEKAQNGYEGIGDSWAGDGYGEWIAQKNVIKRSLEYVRELDDSYGIALFSYRLLFDPLTGEPIEATREECSNFMPVFKDM